MPTPIQRARFSRRVRGTPWLLAAALLFATPLWAQEPGTWVPMADLNQARGGHTATLLANGSVLIAGGKDVAGQPLASAEIYDPATGRYARLTSPLPTPVWGHTATRLNDGTILIAGGNGNDGQPVADAQLFDPAAGTFIRVGSMSTPRSQHTSTLLGDGRVLLAGGTDGVSAVAQLELYDPDARAVSGAPSSPAARTADSPSRPPRSTILSLARSAQSNRRPPRGSSSPPTSSMSRIPAPCSPPAGSAALRPRSPPPRRSSTPRCAATSRTTRPAIQ